MSTGFNILFSPVPARSEHPIDLYKKLLSVVLESPNIHSDSHDLTVYRGHCPFDYGSHSNDPNIMYQSPLKGITPREVFDVIDSLQIDDIYVGVSFAYERREWNNEICDSELSASSLIVEYEAPTFDGGFRNRRLGPYHLLFDNLKCFSPNVVDFSKCAADSPAALMKLGQYEENVVWVKNLFRRIAAAIRPQHQLMITEGNRVNPLCFHMVYHNELSGYLFDLKKIIQLHASGGGYFYEGRERGVEPDDGRQGNSDPPYSLLNAQGVRYGDSIRPIEEAEDLERKLDFYAGVLDPIFIDECEVSEQAILDAMALVNVESEIVDGNLCASSPRFLEGYLDRFYIQLIETLIAPMDSSTTKPS